MNAVTYTRALCRLAEQFAYRHEPLAVLGESLVLGREWASVTGLKERGLDAFGPAEIHDVFVAEEDGQSRMQRMEIFAADHLGDAIARLYERHAELLAGGSDQTRAAATARSVGALLGALDIERWIAAFAPTVEFLDHRTLGTWSGRGPDAMRVHLGALRELADDVAFGVTDVLDLRPDALVVRRSHIGTAREGGGRYERAFLLLVVVGADGLVVRCEFFDEGQEAAAFTRLVAVAGACPAADAPDLFANEATRLNERFARAWLAHDLDAAVACHSPTCAFDDRRALFRHRFATADEAWTGWRVFFDTPISRWRITPIATRGERLALSRAVFAGDVRDGGGELAIDYLAIDEVGDDGRLGAVVLFDPEDLDAA